MTGIPADLRVLLACPRCQGPLEDAGRVGAPELVCRSCALAYPVEEGIPVLLVDRARASAGDQNA